MCIVYKDSYILFNEQSVQLLHYIATVQQAAYRIVAQARSFQTGLSCLGLQMMTVMGLPSRRRSFYNTEVSLKYDLSVGWPLY